MRAVQHPQMNIGEVDVSKISFDARSRDDIPKILRGLQHLYTDTFGFACDQAQVQDAQDVVPGSAESAEKISHRLNARKRQD